ncbi:hypothetical protein Dsin_021466 [Dipteronia sinensis]|uniref:DUF1985 domain-containing protein n=1 Tax=Dipteronia sinensis TaxID=43782 RepID=A0AAE0A183_9ROSI|nr:hypothetical protein Dsin_021466 [Dipteronia sinensis]
MLLRFREGPFGQYLDLPQLLKIHGKLIHNLLKREIIVPGQRDEEIWLGLGRSKVHFGKEEFCLCSGLKMGMLPQGFNEKKDVEKGSMLKRYFKEKRPNAELVYATMKNLTSEEGEDILKMSYIFMVWAVERITRLTLTDAIGRRIGTGFPRFNRWDFNTNVVNIESKFISMMSLFPWVVHTYEKGLDYYNSLNQDYVCGPLTHKGKDLVKAVQSLTKEEEKEENVGSDEEHDKNFKLDVGDESIYNHYTSASLGRSPDDPPSRKKLFDDTNFQTHKTSIQPSIIADLYSAIGLLIKESEDQKLSFCRAEFAKIREEIKVGDTPAKKSTEEKLGTSKQKYDKLYEEDRDGLTFFDQLEKDHVDLYVETLGKEKSDAQADAVANLAMEESDAQVDTAVNDVGVLPKSDAQAEAEANSNMEDRDAHVDAATKGDGVLPKSDAQADSVANSDGVPPKSDGHEHGDPLADSKMVEDVDNQTILDENEMKEINDCVQLCIEEKLVQKVHRCG